MKINWRAHFIEFVTVVIGITIAFMLNRTYEEQKARKKSLEALGTIIEELKRNDSIVRIGLEYHENLLHLLQTDPDSAVMSIRPSRVSDLAWHLSQNTELGNNIGYSDYSKLTEVYLLQRTLTETNDEAAEKISSVTIYSAFLIELYHSIGMVDELTASKSPLSWKSGWIGIFEDIVGLESRLVTSYETLIPRLEEIETAQ